jgi:CheY-like chemotaxis protein
VTDGTGFTGSHLVRRRLARGDRVQVLDGAPGLFHEELRGLGAEITLADIPVVMLTMLEDRNLGYALGAVGYLTKRIDPERLVAMLGRYRRDLPVFVVDGDTDFRDLAPRMLEREGYSVVEADSGRAGLGRLRDVTPGVVLLDLMMPEMDGCDFVAAVRADRAWRALPIVAITAKDLSPEDHERLNGSVTCILQRRAQRRDTARRGPGPRRRVGLSRPREALMPRILNRDMLPRGRVKRGYEVVAAVEEQEGVAKTRAEAPALVLMAMSLPGFDGWEATRRIKADAATRSIPMIALTAHAVASDRETVLAAGCNDVDTKPIEFHRLPGKVPALLG